MIWRVASSQRFTVGYQEIRTFWDLNEVMRANEWLDMLEDSEWLAHEEARRKAKIKG